MKRALMTGIALFALFPAALAADGGHPPLSKLPLTGTAGGVAPLQGNNSRGFSSQLVEGQPIETRAPEKADDHPAFPGQTRAPYKKSVAFNVTTLASGLSSPWSLAFLPDGKMLITEKTGTMRIVAKDGALSAPIKNVPQVLYIGQVGLLDVALDAHYAQNHRIFFSYSEPVGADKSNIVVASATLDEPGLSLGNVHVIYRVQPALDAHGQSANQGGRIVVGADGNLFVVFGDRSKSPPWLVAQRLDTALGKIVHITPEGKAVPGGPFANTKGALPEIYSLGHRSEEGLTFDPQGQLWEIEHGPRGGDELNRIQAGHNYGWPVIVHGIDYPGTPIGDAITEKPGMDQPVYYWDPVIAPSGLAFYKGSLFPAWQHSVFVGALRGMMLDRLELQGGKVVAEEPLLKDMKARIRDVRVGPDGALYVLTDGAGGKLLKLTPKG
jgi:glucose/arabinose dehydrogenase